MIIDGYSHFSPEEYVKEFIKLYSVNGAVKEQVSKHVDVQGHFLERFPQFVDCDTRIAHLNKYKIDKQLAVIINFVDPNILPLKEEDLVRLCRIHNDGMAREMERAKGRVYTAATVPLNSMHLEDELDHAIVNLGLKGISVPTHARGIPVDKFTKLWERAEKLDVPVWLHPQDPMSDAGRPYENEYDLMHNFGWPFETTLIASRLVFSGMMQRYPNLKVILHHLGAMISFFSGRIAETYAKSAEKASSSRVFPFVSSLQKPPIDYFKKFYCDTAVGGYAGAIQVGLEFFGADHIFFGTDYPWGPRGGEGRLEQYPSVVRDVLNKLEVREEDCEKILWENMNALLKL